MNKLIPAKSSACKLNGSLVYSDWKVKLKMERDNLTLWRSPFMTLYYFSMECLYRFTQIRFTLLRNKHSCLLAFLLMLSLFALNYSDGPHSKVFQCLKNTTLWWSWWIWLGFLSSCGFGTGLHTFVLYLGPFIAEVTMSAYECGTLKFPKPPYPERILCPDDPKFAEKITFWKIMQKVQFESIMWGLGTAIGELPPYFMAQGARLSGKYDDDLQEFEELVTTSQTAGSTGGQTPLTLHKKIELLLHKLIIRAGFLGIVLCASIPNPLFDLAGMTCGHFLVPFWSFFGATFIGKALIKVHLQQFTVIALSSENHVETLVNLIGRIPVYGKRLQEPFLEYLRRQKAILHNKTVPGRQSWLQMIIFIIVLTLILSFIISIVHAFAKNYHRRLCNWQRELNTEIVDKTD